MTLGDLTWLDDELPGCVRANSQLLDRSIVLEATEDVDLSPCAERCVALPSLIQWWGVGPLISANIVDRNFLLCIELPTS